MFVKCKWHIFEQPFLCTKDFAKQQMTDGSKRFCYFKEKKK